MHTFQEKILRQLNKQNGLGYVVVRENAMTCLQKMRYCKHVIWVHVQRRHMDQCSKNYPYIRCSSMVSNRLQSGSVFTCENVPILICPILVPTARSASILSSVSPIQFARII